MLHQINSNQHWYPWKMFLDARFRLCSTSPVRFVERTTPPFRIVRTVITRRLRINDAFEWSENTEQRSIVCAMPECVRWVKSELKIALDRVHTMESLARWRTFSSIHYEIDLLALYVYITRYAHRDALGSTPSSSSSSLSLSREGGASARIFLAHISFLINLIVFVH